MRISSSFLTVLRSRHFPSRTMTSPQVIHTQVIKRQLEEFFNNAYYYLLSNITINLDEILNFGLTQNKNVKGQKHEIKCYCKFESRVYFENFCREKHTVYVQWGKEDKNLRYHSFKKRHFTCSGYSKLQKAFNILKGQGHKI